MAFPTTGVLDNFTGSDATELPTYSANWSANSSLTGNAIISGNAAAAPGSGAYGNYWNPETFGPDCEVYATLPTLPGASEFFALPLRLTTPGGAADGYELLLSASDTAYINRLDDFVETTLGAAITHTFTDGDKIGLEAIGDTLQVYATTAGVWGALDTSRSDGTYSSAGNLMLVCVHGTVRADAFGGGTISSGPPPNPPIMFRGA